MRVNYFSIMITTGMMLGLIKITHLLDKIITQKSDDNAYVSNLMTVNYAHAAKKSTSADKSKNKNDPHNEDKTNSPGFKPPGQDLNQAQQYSNPYETNFLSKGYTEEELKVLMDLSKRRDDLDKYQQQLTLKESFLKAAEDKIASQTKDLQAMEVKINALMAQLAEKSNMRIKSLAKIYENMKASEAATIFDALEMPLLLEIVRNMKEQKVAPIIAQINPQKAKEISLEFAKISDSMGEMRSK